MGKRRDKQPDVASVKRVAASRASGKDAHAHAAWRKWLSALATDADAALAAALAYESLTPEGREAWLAALAADAPEVSVPAVALYAPLLGVEEDPIRKLRIAARVGELPLSMPRAHAGAGKGARDCLIVKHLYLEFVELLECRYDPEAGVLDAAHDPLVHQREVELRLSRKKPALRERPLREIVEELAHAVVADGRARRATPAALVRYIDLFALDASSVRESVMARAAGPGSSDG